MRYITPLLICFYVAMVIGIDVNQWQFWGIAIPFYLALLECELLKDQLKFWKQRK